MRKEIDKWVVRYVMLAASLLTLLSVVIPHHHHQDGMPCYATFFADLADTDGEEREADTHDCGCSGHNLAYLSFSSLTHPGSDGADLHLMPLLVLFDYLDPYGSFLNGLRPAYADCSRAESLYDTWRANATGLRAPPCA